MSNILLGIGISNKQFLSQGLPEDARNLFKQAEKERQYEERDSQVSSKLIILIADYEAEKNHPDKQYEINQLKEKYYYSILSMVKEEIGIEDVQIIYSSDVKKSDNYITIYKQLCENLNNQIYRIKCILSDTSTLEKKDLIKSLSSPYEVSDKIKKIVIRDAMKSDHTTLNGCMETFKDFSYFIHQAAIVGALVKGYADDRLKVGVKISWAFKRELSAISISHDEPHFDRIQHILGVNIRYRLVDASTYKDEKCCPYTCYPKHYQDGKGRKIYQPQELDSPKPMLTSMNMVKQQSLTLEEQEASPINSPRNKI